MELEDIEVVRLLDMPFQDRQGSPYTCGPECVAKIMEYYGEDFREMDLARILKTDEEEGTYVRNIVQFFHYHGLKAVVKQKMTIEDLIFRIDRNIPVMIMLQAWGIAQDYENKYANCWESGHFVVVIGYTDDKILIADPALYVIGYISRKELMGRWHDVDEPGKKTHQLGISVYGKKPKYDKDKIERIK
jgi:ABC-type bacteriocin/lantibiotic exporter with double-glycine peptidase domain